MCLLSHCTRIWIMLVIWQGCRHHADKVYQFRNWIIQCRRRFLSYIHSSVQNSGLRWNWLPQKRSVHQSSLIKETFNQGFTIGTKDSGVLICDRDSRVSVLFIRRVLNQEEGEFIPEHPRAVRWCNEEEKGMRPLAKHTQCCFAATFASCTAWLSACALVVITVVVVLAKRRLASSAPS